VRVRESSSRGRSQQCPVQLCAQTRGRSVLLSTLNLGTGAGHSVACRTDLSSRGSMFGDAVVMVVAIPSRSSYLAPDFPACTKPSGGSLIEPPLHLSLHTMHTPSSSLLAAMAEETCSSRGVSFGCDVFTPRKVGLIVPAEVRLSKIFSCGRWFYSSPAPEVLN
jgi:hypothetical protein